MPDASACPITLGLTRRAAVAVLAATVAVNATARADTTPLQTATKDTPMPAMPRLAYVGCRTTRERNARGDGLVVYRLPADDGPWEQVQLVGDLLNPSFMAFDRAKRMLYAVHGDASEVSAFRIDPDDGRLTFVNQVNCKGKNPVHLAVDPSGRHLVVANHVTSGAYVSSLAVLAIGKDGALGDVVDHVPLTGKLGPHRMEQPFAKPHQVFFDPAGRFLAVPDKGLDLITTYRLDETGKLHPTETPPARAREGAGPRHIAFHPTLPYAFVLNELSSAVMACRYEAATGALTPYQEVSSLPDTFVGFSRASEIDVSPDGRFVYASNRGYESVGAFGIEAATGRLSPVNWVDPQGRTPRFFTLDPMAGRLFAANEDSDTIVGFVRDARTGTLSAPSVVARTGSPTCILLA